LSFFLQLRKTSCNGSSPPFPPPPPRCCYPCRFIGVINFPSPLCPSVPVKYARFFRSCSWDRHFASKEKVGLAPSLFCNDCGLSEWPRRRDCSPVLSRFVAQRGPFFSLFSRYWFFFSLKPSKRTVSFLDEWIRPPGFAFTIVPLQLSYHGQPPRFLPRLLGLAPL